MLYYVIPYCTVRCYTILYYIILFYTILYYTMICYIIRYYTIQGSALFAQTDRLRLARAFLHRCTHNVYRYLFRYYTY